MKTPPNKNLKIETIDLWTEQIGKENLFFSFAIPFLCLFFAVAGISGCFLTAFSIEVNQGLFMGILFVISLFWRLFSRWDSDGMTRFLAFMAILIFLNIILFILQNQAISGFFQIANSIFESLNESYNGSLDLYDVIYNETNQIIFLVYVLFPVTGLLSLGILKKQNIWSLAAIAFPVLFVCCLVREKPKITYLVLLFISVIGILVEGGLAEGFHIRTKDKEEPNKYYLQELKSKVILASVVPIIIISVVSVWILQPLLVKPVTYAREEGAEVENSLLQKIWQVMPGISGSDLQMEAVGGGVDEGELGKTEGFYFGNTKALKITCNEKPEETIYLKGYVGSIYTGTSFDAINSAPLENASSGWNIEGNALLYLQNLPFLRMMYAENLIISEGTEDDLKMSEEIISSALEMKIENLNANTTYTYVPYNTFLNDYYELLAGDGAVASQTKAENIFSYYPLASFEEKMGEWKEQEDFHGVLDKVEASYESYVKSVYLQIPETGLEQLQEECEAADLKEIDEIKEYIITNLDERAAFEMDVESVPKGEDFVTWFLYESKEGYSTHFAAAATIMFRMFGIPARYVVGYAVPDSLFTMQSGGSFMAIVEDDNAHAWTEIYVSGIGWIPVETTPGYVAMLSEDSSNIKADSPGNQEETEMENTEEETEDLKKEQDSKAHLKNNSPVITVLLIISFVIGLILSAFIIRRQYMLKKRLGQLNKVELTEKIKNVYSSIYSLCLFDGWTEAPGCEEEKFSEEMAEKYPICTREDWKKVADIVLKTYYGYDERSTEDLELLRTVYIAVGKEIYGHISKGKRLQYRWWKCYL